MAKTFDVQALEVNALNEAMFAYLTRRYLEGASQTFVAGSPVKFASGFVAEWVSVGDADIVGFAQAAGSNGSAGANGVDVVLAVPDLVVEANFLGGSAADNVLAQADLGIERDLIKDANLFGTGLAGWYIADAAAGAAVIIQEFDHARAQFPNRIDYKPVAGDTNARIRAAIKPGVSAWF